MSTGPVWEGTAQSLIMTEMRERLSGYDYNLDSHSRVSECSFDSFKHYRYQAFGDNEASPEDARAAARLSLMNPIVDVGSSFHRRSLMLKVV